MPATADKIKHMDETADAAEIVERFLVASMVPDPETAARYIPTALKITFTGGRKYSHPSETAAFNAGSLQMGEEEDGAHRRRPGRRRNHRLQSRHPLRRVAGRYAVRRQPLRRSLCRPRAARSCRWTSGTTVPNGCSPATASRRDALSAAAARGDWAGRRSRARRRARMS